MLTWSKKVPVFVSNCNIRILILVLISIFVAGSAWAASQKDVMLYLPLDGSAGAAIAGGKTEPIVQKELKFTEGKFGQGYLSGARNSELSYSSAGNIDMEAGTVAMWVKSIGWAENDAFMRFWFRIDEKSGYGGKGEGTFLWLYKFSYLAPLYWLVQQQYQESAYASTAAFGVWKPDQWTHIAASWSGPVMRLYVNGCQTGITFSTTPHLLRKFGSVFAIGGESWSAASPSSEKPDNVIDEVYVFRRVLTEAELKALAEKGRASLVESETAPVAVDLDPAYYPSADNLKLGVYLSGRSQSEIQGLSIDFTINNASSGKSLGIPTISHRIEKVNFTKEFDTKKLIPGKYTISVSLKDNSTNVVWTGSANFEKPKRPVWLGNKIGIADKVPAPWTPIIKSGQTIKCWGRAVSYKDSLFPIQMVSQKQPLLAGPVRILAKVNGRSVSPTGVKFQWTKLTEQRAEFVAAGKIDTLPIKVEGWMEYDGLVWTKLSVPAKSNATIEELKLEIPIKPEVAELQHGPLVFGKSEDGKVYKWESPIKFQPFMWIGNEDVGLQWSTGDNYCYELQNSDKQVQMIPGEKETVLRVMMVDHSVPLDRSLEYTFGLHPTPVKPMPNGWRAWDLRINGLWKAGIGEKSEIPSWRLWFTQWNTQNESSHNTGGLYGYPAPGPWARKDLEDIILSQNKRAFLYWNVGSLWRGAPEYPAFRSEWNPRNPAPLPFETAGGYEQGQPFRTVPSFRDWAIWRYWTSLKENPWLVDGITGFYNDVVQGFWGVEPRPDRDGTMRSQHELLGVRELQKRMYVAWKNEWPDKVILNHQSGDSHMSQLAFADIYLTGENYRDNPDLCKDAAYYHVWTLDSCRAELLPHHWGVPILFLPEIASPSVPVDSVYGLEGIKPSEHMVGMLLAHDTIPYPTMANPIPMFRVAALKEAFGWDDQTEFIGYWKTGDLVKLTSDQSEVVVSIYRRPGKVMFVVMNDSDKDASVTLLPNWAKLGIHKPSKLVDAYTATGIPDSPLNKEYLDKGQYVLENPKLPVEKIEIPVVGNAVEFSIGKKNFRCFVAESLGN